MSFVTNELQFFANRTVLRISLEENYTSANLRLIFEKVFQVHFREKIYMTVEQLSHTADAVSL